MRIPFGIVLIWLVLCAGAVPAIGSCRAGAPPPDAGAPCPAARCPQAWAGDQAAGREECLACCPGGSERAVEPVVEFLLYPVAGAAFRPGDPQSGETRNDPPPLPPPRTTSREPS